MADIKKHRLRPRERDAIIKSLYSGVTPSKGLQHIQVGRVKEVEALVKDIEIITDGGSVFRLIIGDFGAGKSFFMQLVRIIALEKGLVTVHADLAKERRLYSTGGLARNLFVELMTNLSTRTKPKGKALPNVVERFITEARKKAKFSGDKVSTVIEKNLSHLSELAGGYDFADVIAAYWKGYEEDDDKLKASAVRWLRGAFSTKTDARKALGVRTIVNDANVYDHLKLLSLFVRQAGYGGLLVILDEMVTLYMLPSKHARVSNYEQILRILNDCLQGSAEYIGFLFGGTPDFLFDLRKGLYSYEALRNRLAQNKFAKAAGVIDYNAPTLHLANLSPEDMYILLWNVRHVYASGDTSQYLVPDEALSAFLKHCSKQIGDSYFRTPRNTVTEFVHFLSFLEQNNDIKWYQQIERVVVKTEVDTDMPDINEEDSEKDKMATFRI